MAPDQQALRQSAASVLQNLMQARMVRAVMSERQLNEVLVDFWFNHFNVDARKGRTRFLLTEYEREAIRPHVLGRFRDLLEATGKTYSVFVSTALHEGTNFDGSFVVRITFDACTGAGISMIPDCSSAVRAFRCFFTMLIPSISTRPVFGYTRMIFPSFPLSSPRTTFTVSPLAMCSTSRSALIT